MVLLDVVAGTEPQQLLLLQLMDEEEAAQYIESTEPTEPIPESD